MGDIYLERILSDTLNTNRYQAAMTGNSILHESKHIEWSIKNFFEKPYRIDYKLDSPCVFLSDAEWFLRMYINGQVKYNSYGCLSLYLMRKDTNATLEHDVICRIGIKNGDGTEFQALSFKGTFLKTIQNGLGYRLLQRSQLLINKENVAPHDTLTIFCTFRVEDRSISSSANVKSSYKAPSNGTSTLSKDLKDLYFSSFQSDLTVTVKDKEFRAHRVILSSRSPVFKSMLSHDMMEKNCGRIEIPDGDPDVFEDFLLFLYTGNFDNVSSRNVVSLYNAADKYDVKELKEECARFMANELSDDVFCDVLHLATMHNEKDLMRIVKIYFINNAKTIITTQKWLTFIVEHPLVANELFLQQLISTDVEK